MKKTAREVMDDNVLGLSAQILAKRNRDRKLGFAILTNGKAITEDLGIKLESVTLEDLGQAKKITSPTTTTSLRIARLRWAGSCG